MGKVTEKQIKAFTSEWLGHFRERSMNDQCTILDGFGEAVNCYQLQLYGGAQKMFRDFFAKQGFSKASVFTCKWLLSNDRERLMRIIKPHSEVLSDFKRVTTKESPLW